MNKSTTYAWMTATLSRFLSLNSSNSGHNHPMRPRSVIICWAISNALAKAPQLSCVADPLGPISVLPAIGSDPPRVCSSVPKRNSDAASSVSRENMSWASHGWPDAERDEMRFKVRLVYVSKSSKSEMRSRAKNGRATLRCWIKFS